MSNMVTRAISRLDAEDRRVLALLALRFSGVALAILTGAAVLGAAVRVFFMAVG